MTVETNLTRAQMVTKANALAYCLNEGADEDAFNHLIGLIASLHRMKLQRLVEIEYGLERLKGKP